MLLHWNLQEFQLQIFDRDSLKLGLGVIPGMLYVCFRNTVWTLVFCLVINLKDRVLLEYRSAFYRFVNL